MISNCPAKKAKESGKSNTAGSMPGSDGNTGLHTTAL